MKALFGIAVAAIALAGIVGAATPSYAQNYVVKELNVGPNGNPDQFSPDFLKIQPGDSVTFQADDSGHDVMSLFNGIPAGAQPFQGQVGKSFTVTFTVPGAYVYKCQPHLSFGMVGMIVVGQPTNLDKLSFAGLPRRAHDRLEALVAQARSTAPASR
jgi:pseudoazurin